MWASANIYLQCSYRHRDINHFCGVVFFGYFPFCGALLNLEVGQDAPELLLAPLTFDKDEKGEMVGTIGAKMVKLADFKGKAPVVIFSSSYT